MGFVEQVSKDIDDVFFDEGFFGSKHSLDNKEITVIVDEDATGGTSLLKSPSLFM